MFGKKQCSGMREFLCLNSFGQGAESLVPADIRGSLPHSRNTVFTAFPILRKLERQSPQADVLVRFAGPGTDNAD